MDIEQVLFYFILIFSLSFILLWQYKHLDAQSNIIIIIIIIIIIKFR